MTQESLTNYQYSNNVVVKNIRKGRKPRHYTKRETYRGRPRKPNLKKIFIETYARAPTKAELAAFTQYLKMIEAI